MTGSDNENNYRTDGVAKWFRCSVSNLVGSARVVSNAVAGTANTS